MPSSEGILQFDVGVARTIPAPYLEVGRDDSRAILVVTPRDVPRPDRGQRGMASRSSTEILNDPAIDSLIAEFGEAATRGPMLSPDGGGQDVINNGMGLELMALMGHLLVRRAKLGRSVAEVAHASGLDPEVIEELDSGRIRNPHFDLVWRYALALDVAPTIALEEIEPAVTEADRP